MAFDDSWWSQNDPSQQSLADQVAGLYQQYLGRDPENSDVVQQYIAGTGGNLSSIRDLIAGSPEAATYLKSLQTPQPPAPASGAGSTPTDPNAFLQNLLAQGVDPNSAVDQTNSQFNLPSGSSYAYYAPGSHGAGSGAVIGVPGGGYLAQGPGGGAWNFNQGDKGSAGGGAGSPLSLAGQYAYQPLPGYNPPAAPKFTPINIAPFTAQTIANPTPITLPTAQDVQNTPGYQFQRDQGLLATQRAAAPNGIGGAAMQQAANYAEGLAGTYYQNAVQNALNVGQANFTNQFDVNQANAQNAANAYQMSTNAQLAGAGLNLQGVNQQFQNTYLPSWNAYQSQVGQNQFGANYGLSLGQLGLQNAYEGLYGQNQFWSQGLAENQNAFNQYNTNQQNSFNQWLALAALGNVGNPYA